MDKVRRETLETPAVIVIMSRVHEDEITREEDYAAVMMATANLMTAAQSLGLGTYLKTGGSCAIRRWASWSAFPTGYRIVGVLSRGVSRRGRVPPAAPAGRGADPVARVGSGRVLRKLGFRGMFATHSAAP